MQDGQHVLHLFRRAFEIVVDVHLVADGVTGLAQQSVVVERTDEVFHDVPLSVVEVAFTHLLLEFVIKRHAVGGVLAWALHLHGDGVFPRVVVVGGWLLRGGGCCRFLPRRLFAGRGLQGGVVYELVTDVFLQLVHRLLYHLPDEQLKGGEPLFLRLFQSLLE